MVCKNERILILDRILFLCFPFLFVLVNFGVRLPLIAHNPQAPFLCFVTTTTTTSETFFEPMEDEPKKKDAEKFRTEKHKKNMIQQVL